MNKLVKIHNALALSGGRFFSDAQLEADPQLVAEGWERRFTADEQRAREVMELYSRLGYEVRAEPVRAEELHDDCQDCQSVVAIHFRTIYTRQKAR